MIWAKAVHGQGRERMLQQKTVVLPYHTIRGGLIDSVLQFIKRAKPRSYYFSSSFEHSNWIRLARHEAARRNKWSLTENRQYELGTIQNLKASNNEHCQRRPCARICVKKHQVHLLSVIDLREDAWVRSLSRADYPQISKEVKI
eukprot:scaffold823_cov219-Amphora_coffeaeformis.AAC.30